MAASNLNLGKASGGILSVSPADGTTTTSLVLPASGTVVATDVVVTDNAIARYDGTTGKVQNSGVVIDDNNNVGIGVTPSAWGSSYKALEIKNNGVGISTSGGAQLLLSTNAYDTGAGTWKYGSANSNATLYSCYQGSHSWLVAPSGTSGNAITWTNAMTLTTSNDLYVFNTINSGRDTSGSYYSGSGQCTAWQAGTSYTFIKGTNTSNGSVQVFNATSTGSVKAVIWDNGNFQSATNSYGSTSDAKLKENIVDTTPKLEKLMQVQVRNFNYIGQEDKQIGVIAQEVEKIFPGIVYETKDTKQVEVTKTKEVTDEEGNVTTEEYTETETVENGEVTKNVKYSVIYMMMLKGMQEQQAIINDLKTRIEILEAK